jgi:hypothetical protein
LPFLLGYLLLAGDSAAWALLGAGVGVRTLSTNRKSAAVTDATVAADVHEALDVHRDFGAERSLDAKILFDRLTQTVDVRVIQIANTLFGVDAGRSEYPAGGRATDAEDLGQADLDLLLTRKINARNTRH